MGSALNFSGTASSTFWKRWGDGRAELAGYRVRTERYGKLRQGRLVLITVTETLDSRVWVKDDSGTVPKAFQVPVVKLNAMLNFQTGIYPYAVMTSTFAPVNPLRGRERFSPVKVALSVQEWCGHVYAKLLPERDRFQSQIISYFHNEGERSELVRTTGSALYQDALPIQLRELDGPFAGGQTWRGQLVPSLWLSRKRHTPSRPVSATITRRASAWQNTPVTEYTLTAPGQRLVYHVESGGERRLLHWKGSDGEEGQLLKSARLPYWKLNRPGNESYLKQLGF